MESTIVKQDFEEGHIYTFTEPACTVKTENNLDAINAYVDSLDPDIKYKTKIQYMTPEESKEMRLRIAMANERRARKKFILGIFWALIGPSA